MVRVVLKVHRDGGRHTGVGEDLLGLVQARLAGVAVGVLERFVGAQEAVGNVGVQRQVGALVDLVRDGLAVNEVRDGLADGERLGRIGVGSLGTERHRVEVERDVADFAAGANVDLDLGVLLEVIDVGGAQAAVRDVDVPLLDVQLHVGGVGVVLDRGGVVGRLAEDPLVVRECLEADQLVLFVRVDHVLAVERLGLDDRVVVKQFVGREDFIVYDRRGGAAEDLGEGLVVRLLQLEDHGVGIGGGDAFDVGQQACGTGRIVDLGLPVEGELDVLGVERVAVGPLEARLELDRVLVRRGEGRGLGQVRHGICAAGLRVEEEGVDLVHHHERTVVIRARRIQGSDLVRGAVGDRTASCG
ncbi:hypothetical protein SRABI128_06003 [Microbacterium sp. Bi128]|nr:hypothetical protein SRABI128_06003 [Microbacterium sp. Bi128]